MKWKSNFIGMAVRAKLPMALILMIFIGLSQSLSALTIPTTGAISLGGDFAAVIKSDGTVLTWGSNDYGQLGDGTTTASTTPVEATNLTDVVAIACGTRHVLILKSDGTVWAWGYNYYGQLGDGTTTNRTTPEQVSDLTEVVSISAGEYGSMALRSDGTVWFWGEYNLDGTDIVYTTPIQIPIRLIEDEDDTNSNGISDAWEEEYFGDLAHTGFADSDSDGLSDVLEYNFGTDPTLGDTDGDGVGDWVEYESNYYGGVLPTITSLVDSSGVPGTNGLVAVKVTDSSGNALFYAPVTLAVTTGACEISSTYGGAGSSSVTVYTNSSGEADAYVTFESVEQDVLVATATSGSESTSISITIFPPMTDISGLLLWLKADAGVTADSSGYVSTWADQSGNGNNVTQSTSGYKPLFVSDVLNGDPVIRFDGSNDYFTGTTTSSFKPTNITVMAVYKLSATGSYPKIINQPYYASGWSSPYEAWEVMAGSGSGSAPYVSAYVGSTLYSATSSTSYFGVYTLITETYDGDCVNLYMNGALISSVAASGVMTYGTSCLFYVGARPGGEYLNGDIAEILIYDHALSAAEMIVAGSYITNKYTLSSALPTALTSLTATAVLPTQVSLQWVETSTGVGVFYTIERKTGDGAYERIAIVSGVQSYIDTELTAGNTYSYRIESCSFAGSGGYSNVVAVTTPDEADISTTGLLLWLRADAGAMVNSSGYVSKWLDQSGNGYDATSSSTAYRPTLVSDSLDDMPVIHFNGSQQMYFARPVQDDFTIVTVFRSSQGLGTSYSWSAGAGLVSGEVACYVNDFGACLNANGQVCVGLGNPSTSSDISIYSVTGYNDGCAHLVFFTRNETTGAIASYLDGISDGTAVASTNSLTSPSRLTIGSLQTNTGFLVGDIAEVIIYDRVLTAEELEAVGYYLNCKYDFTDDSVFEQFSDRNSDGLLDYIDRNLGIDPTDLDDDGDGISNADELAAGTDPLNADTDNDGVYDGEDAYPLDPTRSALPASDSSDQTGPTVTLVTPSDATMN